MANPFQDLPSDLHESLREDWISGARPASVLLGQPVADPDQTPSPGGGIADLDGVTHAAISTDVRGYVEERNKAIHELAQAINKESMTSGTAAGQEGFTAGSLGCLLQDKFLDRGLPLTNDTLQHMFEVFSAFSSGVDAPGVFSPLLTAWSAKLRDQGVEQPILELDWTERLKSVTVDFGEGMEDVELHITGSIDSTVGTEARNCVFVFDDVKGELGRDAVSCSFQANTVDALVLVYARDSQVTCSDLKSPLVSINNGCSIEAETVSTTIQQSASFDEEGPIPYEPCTIRIGHLTGTVDVPEDWDVEIGKITEPPIRKWPKRPSSYTESILTKESCFSGDNDRQEYISLPVDLDNLRNKKYSKKDPRQSHIDTRQYTESISSKSLKHGYEGQESYSNPEIFTIRQQPEQDLDPEKRKQEMAQLIGSVLLGNVIRDLKGIDDE